MVCDAVLYGPLMVYIEGTGWVKQLQFQAFRFCLMTVEMDAGTGNRDDACSSVSKFPTVWLTNNGSEYQEAWFSQRFEDTLTCVGGCCC